MSVYVLGFIVGLVVRVDAGSMCCKDASKSICSRLDHTCQCPNNVCSDPYAMRNEVETFDFDGPLCGTNGYLAAFTAATQKVSRLEKEDMCTTCPSTTIREGVMTATGCIGDRLQYEGYTQDQYYSCPGYSEDAKVVYNTCKNTNPSLFWSPAPGSFGICARDAETNDCKGGELHTTMYLGQIKADGDVVSGWYKKATYGNKQDTDCTDGLVDGWRWRSALGTEGYKESCSKLQLEFEEPIQWFTANDASSAYSEEALLGSGWSMMQLRFGSDPVQNTPTHGQMGNRCFYSDNKLGTSGVDVCPDNTIHPGGVKFVLELDQEHGDSSYPHGEAAYWDDCIAAKTGAEKCLHCFVVDYSVKGDDMTVTADKVNKRIVATQTSADGVVTTFTYSFEDIVNTVNPTGWGDDFGFVPGASEPDFPYNFKQATVILEDDNDITRAYVCLDKDNYDPTNDASFQCPQHSSTSAKCSTSFLYDPEMIVADNSKDSAATAMTCPFTCVLGMVTMLALTALA